MERTPEQKKEWLEYMNGKAIDDIQLELEAKGVLVSEEDIIDEIEYQAREHELEEAMIEEAAIENDMS